MQQHSSSTCLYGIYLSIDMIFQRMWFLSCLPKEWVVAIKEVTEPRVKLKSSLRKLYGRQHKLVGVTNDHRSAKCVVITLRSCPHQLLITGCVRRVTRPCHYQIRNQLSFKMTCGYSRTLVGVRFAQYLVFSLLLCFFFSSLHCLPCDLRLLITPIVYLNVSLHLNRVESANH